MPTLANLIVRLTADANEFYKELEKSEGRTQGFLNKLGGQFVDLGKGVIAVGAGAAAAGLAGLTAGLVSSTQAAMEAQQIEAQLDAVLKSTGGVAGVTKDQVTGLADSLAGLTAFEDDTIISGENMLLTFTNIGKDVFPLATETMLDMSQALGQDLQASAIQLGKALQNPVEGVTALQRVGVNFTDSQRDMIAGLVEAGKVEEAQMFILRELQTEFGGSAKAAGETFAGKLTILKNRLGNVQETIGGALLPILTELVDKVLVPAMPVVERIGDAVMIFFENINSTLPLFENVQIAVSQFFQTLGMGEDQADTIGTQIATLAQNIQNGLGVAIQFISDNKDAFLGALAGIGAVLGSSAVVAGLTLVGGLLAGLVSPIGLLIAGAALLGAAWAENWGGIRDVLTNFWEQTAKPALTQLVEWLKVNLPVAIKALADFWTGTLAPAIKKVADFIKADVVPIITEIWTWLAENLPEAIQLVSDFFNNVYLPVMQKMWDFLQNYIFPVLESLAKTYLVGVKRAVKDVSEAWNTMATAMGAIKRWIDESVIPAFEKLMDFLNSTFGPALNTFKTSFLDVIVSAFAKLGETIQNILKFLGDLITKLSGVDLPGWLGGGGGGGGVQQAISIPGLSAAGGAGGAINVSVPITATVANDVDVEALAWRVSEIIGRRLERR